MPIANYYIHMREYHTYPNFTKICRHTQADSDSTCHQQSSESFRYVNMSTLLSRTASCHNASLLHYSPGNDLQVDPATDCLEGPATVERATAGAALDSLPSFMCMCC